MCRVACALLTTPISYYKQIYLSTTKGAYNIGVDNILKRAIIYASGMRAYIIPDLLNLSTKIFRFFETSPCSINTL